ncbi:MAG: AI-2E family transporter, partial [Candidatus Hydrogenedentota bacterium]
LVPFTLAAFLTLVMVPVVDFLIKHLRVPRPIALILTMGIGFLIVLGIASIVSVSVSQFAANAGQYESQLSKLVEQAEEKIPIDRILATLGAGNPAEVSDTNEVGIDVASAIQEDSAGVEIGEDGEERSAFDVSALLPPGTIKGFVGQLSTGVLAVLSNGFLVMLFTAFLLTGGTTSSRTKSHGGVIGEIQSRVQKYIAIKIVLSGVTGFLVFIILKVLGVDYALSFGTFAFILNFIPNLGSLVATFLPIPIVLLTPDVSTMTVVLVFALPMAVQILIGSILEPKIMGDTLGLHPVVILMALIFWGMLWGFSGMLLAVPMTAIAKIIFERIEVTKPMAAIMAGRLDSLDET